PPALRFSVQLVVRANPQNCCEEHALQAATKSHRSANASRSGAASFLLATNAPLEVSAESVDIFREHVRRTVIPKRTTSRYASGGATTREPERSDVPNVVGRSLPSARLRVRVARAT